MARLTAAGQEAAGMSRLSCFHGLPVISGPAWRGLTMFTTTRLGGHGGRLPPLDLSCAADRTRLESMLPGPTHWLDQVHGTVVVNEADIRPSTHATAPRPQADALITIRENQVLAILTADCLPVVLACSRGRLASVVHAGWRGLAGGVLEAALAALRRADVAGDAQWRAWIGPSITQPHFEVGDDVYQAFMGADAACDVFFMPGQRPGKWLADLQGLARHRLYRAGVARVDVSGHCTWQQADWFHSYRRHPHCGRQVTVAWRQGANHLPSLTVPYR